jgi:dihydrofolate reductase
MKLILLMAVTADGMIARDAEHFPDWTGAADKRFFARRSREAGVVIMGAKTFDTLARPLPGRRNIVLSRDPTRVSRPPDLVFTAGAPGEILAGLAAEGFQEAILAGGARINTLFAARGLIDEVILTVSPLLFGQGLALFSAALDLRLGLIDLQRLDDDLILLHYRVIY